MCLFLTPGIARGRGQGKVVHVSQGRCKTLLNSGRGNVGRVEGFFGRLSGLGDGVPQIFPPVLKKIKNALISLFAFV
jgi:hypothetical protein